MSARLAECTFADNFMRKKYGNMASGPEWTRTADTFYVDTMLTQTSGSSTAIYLRSNNPYSRIGQLSADTYVLNTAYNGYRTQTVTSPTTTSKLMPTSLTATITNVTSGSATIYLMFKDGTNVQIYNMFTQGTFTFSYSEAQFLSHGKDISYIQFNAGTTGTGSSRIDYKVTGYTYDVSPRYGTTRTYITDVCLTSMPTNGWFGINTNKQIGVDTWYSFHVYYNGDLRIYKYVAGASGSILASTGYGAIDPYVWHRYKVVTTGGNLKFYVDGVKKLEYTDASPLGQGGHGFMSTYNPYASTGFYVTKNDGVDFECTSITPIRSAGVDQMAILGGARALVQSGGYAPKEYMVEGVVFNEANINSVLNKLEYYMKNGSMVCLDDGDYLFAGRIKNIVYPKKLDNRNYADFAITLLECNWW